MVDASDKLLQQLQALRDQYAAALPAKLKSLREGLDTLCQHWDPELLATLHRDTHSLTGSGATFGYNDISHCARKLEVLLRQLAEENTSPQHPAIANIEALLIQLEQAQLSPVEPSPFPSHYTPSPQKKTRNKKTEQRLVFVVNDDSELSSELRLQYELHDYKVHQFQAVTGLQQAIKNEQPLAIIMHVAFAKSELDGMETIADLRQQLGAQLPPVIFISENEDLASRLASVRAGAAAYFTTPVDQAELIETMDRLTTPEMGPPYRILIVDDDEKVAFHNALLLQRAGMDTQVLTKADRILELLPVFQPELILMDLYLPDCTGIELAAVIRQQPHYVGTPIVFFSMETDIDKHLDAMRVGGDDFLLKTMTAEHLLISIKSRVRRARTITQMMVRDSLTGLLNHSSIEEQLRRELGLQQRHNEILSYALMDLDHFKQVNDQYGHAAGDRVIQGFARLLRQRFRQTDLLGRYGGEEFVVVLPGTDAEHAKRLVDEVRKAFSQIKFSAADQTFSVSFSAGVASAPPFLDSSSLQEAADKSLYQAKRDGRNCVLIAKANTD